jgi:hypothetical protein
MNQAVVLEKLHALIEPARPKGGTSESGRPPVALDRMLRICFLQTSRTRPWTKRCTTRPRG